MILLHLLTVFEWRHAQKFSMCPKWYIWIDEYEPRCEKTGFWGFQPGQTQTRL